MKQPQLEPHEFPSKGKGLSWKGQPLPIRFPENIEAILRSFGTAKQDFVRTAVIEKLERDHLLPLPDQVAEVAIEESAPAVTIEPSPEPTPKKTRGRPKKLPN